MLKGGKRRYGVSEEEKGWKRKKILVLKGRKRRYGVSEEEKGWKRKRANEC